ncbi:MAG: glycosyltransferase, partial [Sphingobium sp.]
MNRNRPDVAIILDRFGGGGVEKVACHLANGLSRRGMKVEFVVTRDAGPVRHLLDDDVSIHVIKTIGLLPRGGRLLAGVPALTLYLRKTQPKLFHSPGNHTHMAGGMAVRMSRYKGAFLPKITNPIIKDGMASWKQSIRRLLYSLIFKTADSIIVLSQSGIRKLSLMGKDLADKAIFLHNPYISDDMLNKSTSSTNSEVPLILSVGRLSKQKDHATLFHALALLKYRPWNLRICGDGPKKAELVGLASDLGIDDRVEFTGFVDDVVPHYAQSSVLALSSEWEDLPA